MKLTLTLKHDPFLNRHLTIVLHCPDYTALVAALPSQNVESYFRIGEENILGLICLATVVVTVRWIAMEFDTHDHDPQRIYSVDFSSIVLFVLKLPLISNTVHHNKHA